MKKIMALMLAAMLVVSLIGCGGAKKEETAPTETPAPTEAPAPIEEPAAPAEEPAAPAEEAATVAVQVAISDTGKLVVAYETVLVPDGDGDGVVSIEDTLAAAHDAFYEGGAEEGFLFEESEYGKTIARLWGVENGGSYGYELNDDYAYPTDPVVEGDELYAYSYADLATWTDVYTYFTEHTAAVKVGEELTVTLMKVGYDESWNRVASGLEGAVVTVNGEATEFVTDAEGNAVVTFAEAGTYVLSAVAEGQILVPAVCTVTVE